jgi:hypothetical protein
VTGLGSRASGWWEGLDSDHKPVPTELGWSIQLLIILDMWRGTGQSTIGKAGLPMCTCMHTCVHMGIHQETAGVGDRPSIPSVLIAHKTHNKKTPL